MTTTRLFLLLNALVRLILDIAARRRRPDAVTPPLPGSPPPSARSGPSETGGA